MADVNPVPDGYEGLIAHLTIAGAADAMEFYALAFGAEEICRSLAPDGTRIMHAEMQVGPSKLYLCDDFPEWSGKPRTARALGTTPVTLHHFVADTDASVQKAVDAGAALTMPPADMFWGDRYGVVTDPWGNLWSFATHMKDVSPEEMAAAAEAAFSAEPTEEPDASSE